MQELVHNHKSPILESKSNISEQDILNMNSSKTSEVDSTLKEKDLMPYWNRSCLEMSKRLLSLTKTDCVDLDTPCLNQLQANTIQGSWFSMKQFSHLNKNLCKTYFPSSMFSPVGFMDLGSTVVRSKKIRIYPQNKQQYKLYCNLSRFWFNKAVDYLNKPNTKAYIKEVRHIQKQETSDWAFESPQRIREHAMADACSAVKNAKIKFKQTGVFQKVSFRKKKDTVQGFGFDASSLKDDFIFRNLKYKLKFSSTEAFEAALEGTRVVCEDNRWFLIVPQVRNIKTPENQRNGVVALDPGLRTFITYFNPIIQGKIGSGDFNRIFRLCLRIDSIISLMSKSKCRTKRKLKRTLGHLRWKVYNLVDDLHKKVAYFLVTRFDKIIIPFFETRQMVTKLRSKTARSLLSFAHYRFKQFLKIKAEEYSCEVIEISEAYTSKTCSYCGSIQNIGSRSNWQCKNCGIKLDRDYNGARGIFLRALVASPSLLQSANQQQCEIVNNS